MADFTVRARIEAEDRASAVVGKAQGSFQRFGSFLASRFVVTFGEVARVVEGAMRRVREAVDLRAQEQALRRQLAAVGQDFDTFIGKLKEVSDNTVSAAKLIESSSTALLLGIPAEKIADLLEVARASAAATGTSVAKAFDDIATGMGRASPLILDNLGITVKLGDAYQAMADELGTTVEKLDETQKKQALLNKVLEVGKKRVDLFGDAAGGLKAKLEQGEAAISNFNRAVNNFTLALADGALAGDQGAEAIDRLTAAVESAEPGARDFGEVLGEMFRLITFGLSPTEALGRALITKLTVGFDQSAKNAAVLNTALKSTFATFGQVGAAASEAGDDLDDLADSTKEVLIQFDALEKSADILGTVTSQQLTARLIEINQALEVQKEVLGESSAEYQKLRETADKEIEKILRRIESLKAGLGDIGTAAEESGTRAGEALRGIATEADNTANQIINAAARSRQAVFISQTSTRDQRAGRDFSTSSFPVTIGGGTFTTRNPANNFIPARTA